MFCANLENRIFLPHFAESPVFMNCGTAHERAAREKKEVVFGFKMENYINLNVVFLIYEAQTQFYRQIKIFF